MGYASLFEYAVQALSYSEAAAGRRISAMRLLVEIPEIESALKSGQVNLSTLCAIHGFAQRKEEPISKDQKRDLVFAMQGKSRRECEKELAALDPVAAAPKERERVVSPELTEIRFVADDTLMEKLKRIRELDAHVIRDDSYLNLFHRMADLVIKKLDPVKKLDPLTAPESHEPTPPAESVDPRAISATLKRAVWRCDGSRCTYVSSDGRRCSSRYRLEMDHKIPVSLGGKGTFDNLRLLCRAHNQHQAIVRLGPLVMASYMERYLASVSR